MKFENKTFVALGSSIVLGLVLLIYLGYRRFYCRKKLGKRAVVKSLYLYPVKSCAGIKLDKVEIKEVGPLLDRAWVLVNSNGHCQYLSSLPKLALVQPSFEDNKYLCLNAPGMQILKLDIHMQEDGSNNKSMVSVLGTSGEGLDCGDEAGEWFDKFLGKTGLRLLNGLNKNLKHRELHPVWQDAAKEGDRIIFSNAAPVLLTSEESLAALNKDLSDSPVDMRYFRPSIVVQGCEQFEEETWNTISIGNVLLRKFKNCSRCPTVVVDPDSGIMKNDGEPLETLKRTHVGVLDKRLANKPLFGVYFITDQSGSVLEGDAVDVLA